MNLSVSAPPVPATPPAAGAPRPGAPRSHIDAWGAGLVVAVALAASWSALSNGFAYDDLPIIVENTRVHALSPWWTHFASPYWSVAMGGSLYRPLTTFAYALEWSAGGGKPLVFHAASVALYALVGVTVFAFLRDLLDRRAALAGAVLFAAHPLHTEVVANVVGQAELLAALAVITAVRLYLRARATGGPTLRQTLVLALLYLTGSLCKEHALLLPLLLAAAELLPVRRLAARPTGGPPLARCLAVLTLVGAGVFAARDAVTGSLLGERPVVEMDATTRVWMMFRVAPEWLRLFVWPAHLSAEYGPQQIEVLRGPSLVAMLGMILAVAWAVAFVVAVRRSRQAAFALAWLAITLAPASNLVTGLVLEERTLFLPSVAIAMLATLAFARVREALTAESRQRIALAVPAAATAVLLVLGIVRSARRNPVWHDNMTLFAQTVRDAPRSYRAHYVYGRTLFELGRAREGELELRQAIALVHNDADPFNYLATKYREVEAYQLAIPLYRQALSMNPRRPDARFGLALSLLESGDVAGARAEAETGLKGGQLRSYFDWVLARADSVKR